jgi:hypothetical protein
LAPLNRGGLNSTHIHGTRAPVEEPSTASKADIHGRRRHVRSGPKADIEPFYSINVIGFFPQVKNARRILGRLSADADAC